MGNINQSHFIGVAKGRLTHDNAQSDPPDNEFYNTSSPQITSRSSGTGLAEYSGTFGQAQLTHLLSRALFGVTPADVAFFNGMTLDQVVAVLLTPAATPAPPLNAYSTTDANVPFGETWVEAPLGTDGTITSERRYSLKEWWIGLMINQDRSITEKMTLFWHNSFATQTTVIQDPRYCYKHVAMLRANALGNYKSLTRLVTTDPGMLVYLNGNTNTKSAPNENYGREMQELFTVGKGPNSLYTQGDVEAAAKVLTGWKDDSTTISYKFTLSNHDTSDKQFSAFYNNTVITGQSTLAGAQSETDQLIDMIFQQPETAKFLSRKLYRWFLYYDITQDIEDNVISPLAEILIENNFEMIPVLSALLKSEHFFDSTNMGCLIKNPVDHIVGICRQFSIPFPDSSNLANQYKAWGIIDSLLVTLAMDPGDPPNVAGWPAYYQEPQFHELWINSDTLPARSEYSDAMGSLTGIKNSGIVLQIDFIAFALQLSNPSDPNQLIADSTALLSANDLSSQTAFLKGILLSGQTADYYWTDAWNLYLSDTSNTTNENTVLTRLRQMYSYIMELAEYQLV